MLTSIPSRRGFAAMSPEQRGFAANVGEWVPAGYDHAVYFRQGWRLTADHNIELRPTHWLPYPKTP